MAVQKYVSKFGGTSLASAEQIKKAAEIIKSSATRRYIVVSAPGKRSSDDTKVTDLLIKCFKEAKAGEDYSGTLNAIKSRYAEIVVGLGIDFDLDAEMELIEANIKNGPEEDYLKSRGEYLNAKIIAKYLGFAFLDAADAVIFKDNGDYDAEETNEVLGNRLRSLDKVVVPGFYGSRPDGSIKTFSRGGSDISGAIVARAIMADLYENWTDVSGVLAADPRIVENPHVIEAMTYKELRELSYMGASVMHDQAVFPVRKANITMVIKNTNSPQDAGTMVSAELPRVPRRHKVTGIAGKKGFTSILIDKSTMNSEIGFCARLLSIFARHGISIEHMPTGIDTVSVIVHTEDFIPKRDQILGDLKTEIEPDVLYVEDGLAIIAVVGQGMAYSRGTAARIFKALADERINIKMIDQGSTEINIIIGIDEVDYEASLRSIYKAIAYTM